MIPNGKPPSSLKQALVECLKEIPEGADPGTFSMGFAQGAIIASARSNVYGPPAVGMEATLLEAEVWKVIVDHVADKLPKSSPEPPAEDSKSEGESHG